MDGIFVHRSTKGRVLTAYGWHRWKENDGGRRVKSALNGGRSNVVAVKFTKKAS